MIIVSKKNPANQQEVTPEQWDLMKIQGIQSNFKILDSKQSPVRKALEFPKSLEVKTIKKTDKKKKL